MLLREAITYTAAQTGLVPRLLEKDYFCSVVLEYLASCDDGLIFKGGTCLAKIHTGFYRLSEDLDFSIPTPSDASRADRRKLIEAFKQTIEDLPERLPGFQVVEPLQGANNSTQYVVSLRYESHLDSHLESVSIDVGMHEPLIMEPYAGMSRTALLDPLDGQSLVEEYPVQCYSYLEAMAEKLRAALCRRDVAIRDFFDVDYAMRQGSLDIHDEALVELLKIKLAIPGTAQPDIGPARMAQLQRQVEAQLRPVLREADYAGFDLPRAIEAISQIAGRVG